LRALVTRLHIYAGLLTFAQLVLYGTAGLVATFHPGGERPKIVRASRYVPFSPPPSATDREVAAAVYRELALPLTRPMPDWYLRRTPEQDLLLDFHTINGIYRVVVLEREGRVRIDEIRNSPWLFLVDAHASVGNDRQAPALLRAWGIYNELASLCLLAFVCSGLYLWLASDRRAAWTWASLLAGVAVFALSWMALR
jgi:hypothetical protein